MANINLIWGMFGVNLRCSLPALHAGYPLKNSQASWSSLIEILEGKGWYVALITEFGLYSLTAIGIEEKDKIDKFVL